MTPELAEALAKVTTFAEALAAIHAAGYTGTLTLDCYRGIPQAVVLPAPPTPPRRIPLGKPAKLPRRG